MCKFSVGDWVPALLALAAVLLWLREQDLARTQSGPMSCSVSGTAAACSILASGPANPTPHRIDGELAQRPAVAPTDPEVRGLIRLPREGERVERQIQAEVEVVGVPAGYFTWLAVEHQGLIWPKEPAIPAPRQSWKGVIHEGGQPTEFAVSLWLVPPEGHRFIREWFQRSAREGFPGLREIPGATRLHTVRRLELR